MKKFSIGIIILAFIISCSNGSKENADNINETDKEKQIVSIVKPENPQGPTVALNPKDFNVKGEGETVNNLGDIYNGTLYYKGNIFTGKVTFDTFYSSGYFFVKDGKLEGEYEKNYKKSGIKRIDTYKNNNILSRSETKDGVTAELIFDANSEIPDKKVSAVNTVYEKDSYLPNIKNRTGELEKKAKDVNSYISNYKIIEENGNFYKIVYSFSDEGIVERIFKLDSKADNIETLVEERFLNGFGLNTEPLGMLEVDHLMRVIGGNYE